MHCQVLHTLRFVCPTATGEEWTIFVPEDEEPKTQAEKVMAAIGMKKVDMHGKNIAIGGSGVLVLILVPVLIVALDVNTLRTHFKTMMLRNLRVGFRHLRQRGARVAPM